MNPLGSVRFANEYDSSGQVKWVEADCAFENSLNYCVACFFFNFRYKDSYVCPI